MLLRNTDWCLELLEEALSQPYAALAQHPWWEQAALFLLLHRAHVASGTSAFSPLLDDPPYRPAPPVVQLPQYLMNSYPKELSGLLVGSDGNPLHATFQRCDAQRKRVSRDCPTLVCTGC